MMLSLLIPNFASKFAVICVGQLLISEQSGPAALTTPENRRVQSMVIRHVNKDRFLRRLIDLPGTTLFLFILILSVPIPGKLFPSQKQFGSIIFHSF
ncbi:hypothetical protein CYR55_20355 [Chimaeribacter californicus]|uniref:Uncharacterized protein n=1 Tax=Chimaeribacter californicus TaxID=2060067 RepID=A0A2N5DWQ3_9GAMM|nr:hypothetical protein CYR55_20355 [Chimaeribacter californicus]